MRNFYFTIYDTNVSPGIPGESAFFQNGIDYQIPSDLSLLSNKTISIIGDGIYALESAAVLSGICKKIYMINEGGKFCAPAAISSKILSLPSVLPLYYTVPKQIMSEAGRLAGLSVRDKTNGNTAMINCSFILNAQDICGRVSTSVNM